MKIYKNGKEAFCIKEQLDLMLKSGWSREPEAPEVKKAVITPEATETPDVPVVEEDTDVEETPEDEDEDDGTSPVGSRPRRKLLKKKKD